MTRLARRKKPRQAKAAVLDDGTGSPPETFPGGRLRPLSPRDRDEVVGKAEEILGRIGMADVPDWLAGPFRDLGAVERADGRWTFGAPLLDRALARAARELSLPGYREERGLEIGGGRVHIGTGGAAVQVLDAATGRYRDSHLADLYRMMRLLDASPHIHYGVRPLVARDMATPLELDLNTAYACLKGTGKPIGISFCEAGHVEPVAALFDMALAPKLSFRRQPFCMAIVVHVVPPLRFAPEGLEIMRAAIAAGMPLQICSAGQAGATSPAALAGALAQGLAECLAGLMVVEALAPGHPCIFAFMPFISDLRTGAMSGGGGESAIANAAAAQLLRHLDLPSTVSAGMTDSKVLDSQAGYEKGYSVALAAHGGADMINLAVGMLGSIMVASPEALLIDNEMCGAILRSLRGVEVDAGLIDLEAMERVVTGDGHYLGEPQTLALMKSEYLYPELGDRLSVEDWVAAGSKDQAARAEEAVREILARPLPDHLPVVNDKAIRAAFPIRLPLEDCT